MARFLNDAGMTIRVDFRSVMDFGATCCIEESDQDSCTSLALTDENECAFVPGESETNF